MIKLKESKTLHRKIRRDEPAGLAIPTWDFLREAIQARQTDEALDLLSYEIGVNKRNSDVYVSFIEYLSSYIASLDEAKLEQALRARSLPRVTEWLKTETSTEEALQQCTELQRGHHGEFTVTEEPDRYVVRCDPCGSGGRLRRTRSVGLTKKAYPWSWGRKGVPYYCTHCSMQWEIVPIELRGYPTRITIPGDKPEDPCIQYFYKKPELIPEEFFKKVGKTKKVK